MPKYTKDGVQRKTWEMLNALDCLPLKYYIQDYLIITSKCTRNYSTREVSKSMENGKQNMEWLQGSRYT